MKKKQGGNRWDGLLGEKPKQRQPAEGEESKAPPDAENEKPQPQYPMPADTDEARAWLLDLAEHLENLRFPTSTIPIQRAKYAAGAIRKYLKDTEEDNLKKSASTTRPGPMERAFGLSKPRGAPTTKELEHIGIARKMLAHKGRNMTNAEIMDTEGIDENVFREWERHLSKHAVTVMSEDISRQMAMTPDQLANDPLLRELAEKPPPKLRKIPGVKYNGDQCNAGYWSETAPKEMTWVCCNPLCKMHQM